GKIRAFHLPGQSAGEAEPRTLETEHAQVVFRLVSGEEKRKALNVIPMRVGEEHAQTDWLGFKFLSQRQTERADAGASVEHDQLAIGADFNARGIATVIDRGWSGGGNRAAHAPEFHATGIGGIGHAELFVRSAGKK